MSNSNVVKEIGEPTIVDGVKVYPVKIEGKIIIQVPKGSYVPPVGTKIGFRLPTMDEIGNHEIFVKESPAEKKSEK